ncbi:MAG: response regulator [Phormidesmis sp.]
MTAISATKVMVVEDESVISLDIKNSLTKLGYTVSGVAASGEVALMKIQNNRPDLILMDIHLKGEMSGIDVSEKVKSDFGIPIVYLTANADSSTFQEAKDTDPYGYLIKPFEERELGIAIEIALNKHQKEQVVRSSESWYASAFQSLNEAVVATDPHGYVVFMNTLAESITGWLLAEAIDRPVTNVLKFQRKIQQFDQIDLKESVSSILGAVLRGKAVVPLPHGAQLASKTQATVAVEGSATAIRDGAGNITGSLFIFRRDPAAIAAENPVSMQPSMAMSKQSASKQPVSKQLDSTEKSNTAIADNQAYIDNDDVALVKAFVQAFIKQQPALLSTHHLVASSGKSSTTLTTKAEGIIVNVQTIDGKLTAIVKQASAYWELVRHVLIENSFFPVSRRTNGTCYFQHRTIPDNCQIYHTSAMELWDTWHGKAGPDESSRESKLAGLSRERIVVLRRGSWYHIQKLALANDTLHIKTVGGEIFLTPEDSLIWGVQK